MKSIVFILIASALLSAQELNLPQRNTDAPSGSNFSVSLIPLTRTDREEEIFQQVCSGNIPKFIRTFVPIEIVKEINGKTMQLKYFVAPEYLAIGHDSDYFLCPMTPFLAQRIADSLHCTLPTKNMVDQIYKAATVKLRPQPIPPDTDMIKVSRFIQHNDAVQSIRNPLLATFPLGALVAGHKKDIIIHEKIYSQLRPNRPSPVVIYGWHTAEGVPIQPPNNWHQDTYMDYSHGVRLVLTKALLDGTEVSLIDLMRDEMYHVFITDSVLTKPYYSIPKKVE